MAIATQIQNIVQGKLKLWKFLQAAIPDVVPYGKDLVGSQSKEDLIQDIFEGVDAATMAIRVTLVQPLPFFELVKELMR